MDIKIKNELFALLRKLEVEKNIKQENIDLEIETAYQNLLNGSLGQEISEVIQEMNVKIEQEKSLQTKELETIGCKYNEKIADIQRLYNEKIEKMKAGAKTCKRAQILSNKENEIKEYSQIINQIKEILGDEV